jgi:hypothetical protein
MKKRDCFSREGVNGVGFVVLEIVTSLASPCEVFGNAPAASGEWDDVLIGESVWTIVFLANAVFAATLRALLDQQSKFFGKSPPTHEEQV